MVKLVCLDVDGTLFNSESKVNQYTKDEIKKYIDEGILFAFATGRGYKEMDLVLKEIKSIPYAISANGSYIFNTLTNEEIFLKTFKKENAVFIYNIVKNMDIIFEVYTNNTIYASKKNSLNQYIPKKYINFIKETRTFVNIDDFILNLDPNQNILRCHIFFKNETQREEGFLKLKKALKNNQDKIFLDIIRQTNHEIDITCKNINKGFGIKKLADFLGVKKDEILSFGDNLNDIPMKDSSKLIAMGNSEENLKTVADYITVSNDENGIIYALKKIIG